MGLMATSSKRAYAICSTSQVCGRQNPCPCGRPLPTHVSARDSWTLTGTFGSVSCGVTAHFSWVLVHTRFCLCPPRFHFPSPAGREGNGNLLHERLCPTQVCCTQSLCPCSRPLLTHTSTGDTQILKGRSGSVSVESPGVHKVLFEPSECFWQVWSLFLNAISPLLPSCWGFSFALGREVYSFFAEIQHSPVDGCSVAIVILEKMCLRFICGAALSQQAAAEEDEGVVCFQSPGVRLDVID